MLRSGVPPVNRGGEHPDVRDIREFFLWRAQGRRNRSKRRIGARFQCGRFDLFLSSEKEQRLYDDRTLVSRY